ncbi:MAG: HD domain-containing protein [Ignavibacteriales bacterium]|nr:HD domain-containing protein [Ignavibacteriales bacterium]
MNVLKVGLHNRLLKEIGDLADRAGLRVYVVGGYVRDELLGKAVKDIDIVVVGNGVEFAKTVARAWGKANLVVYEKFGTAMLLLDDHKIEFVGARAESYSRKSRKPAVKEASLEEDLSRRDFTINSIAASLRGKDFGNIVDPFDGRKDLRKGVIRTPLEPEKTFDDDPLRIIRAMRFASQLSFDVEPSVLKAARKMAPRLEIVSQERISDEFLKIMGSTKPSVGLQLMFDAGVMKIVFPDVFALAGVEQRKEYHHKDVFLHTMKVVDNVAEKSESLWLRFAALLHDIAKPKTKAFKEDVGWTFHGHEEAGARMVKPIFRRMKFPMEHVPFVEKLVRLHLRPMALVDDLVTDSAVRRLMFEAGDEIDDLMILCRADITSKNPKMVEQVRRNYENVARKMKEVEEKDHLRHWQPPVKGEEIMKVCGIEPGRAVGRLKQRITDAVLDGVIPNDHDAALKYLLEIKDEILSTMSEIREKHAE